MIDPELSLAFSVFSNPGVYALLLGSGVSRSAEIPTGWEVVLDLIKKTAALKDADPGDDPEAWYRTTFGINPEYSNILDDLAKTPAERSQALRPYFEATEAEQERGAKSPTGAHRAIAELIKAGYIRVVLTTNFDRLLESALQDVGIQPHIIDSTDAALGALPLAHAKALIVKINGDYMDSRIRNTRAELESYEPSLVTLLDQLFADFGLIVCGWSGDSDIALCGAIERCPSRRFSTYWVTRGEPKQRASDLIAFRHASLIRSPDADTFFSVLREKVFAVQDLGQHHPLSAKVARAQSKRYIVRAEDRILLNDLVIQETNLAYEQLSHDPLRLGQTNDYSVEMARRLQRYESVLEVLAAIEAVGASWGENEHKKLWQMPLSKLGSPILHPGDSRGWTALDLYPATFLMYVGGIAAVAARKASNLATIFIAPIRVQFESIEQPAAIALSRNTVFRDDFHRFIPGFENNATPLSSLLLSRLGMYLSDAIPIEADYEKAFHLFEYLQSVLKWNAWPGRAPIGCAYWRQPELFANKGPSDPYDPFILEVASMLFPNGISDYVAAKNAYDPWVASQETWLGL